VENQPTKFLGKVIVSKRKVVIFVELTLIQIAFKKSLEN